MAIDADLFYVQKCEWMICKGGFFSFADFTYSTPKKFLCYLKSSLDTDLSITVEFQINLVSKRLALLVACL